ncbi:MAG: hypothetical protein U0802_13075 [Candidatus Binatia bacterium]
MTISWRRIAATAVLAILLANGARAVEPVPASASEPARTPNPRAAISAALLNLVYLPVRLPLTVLGAAFAGMTGWLTFGGVHAADDVFGLVDGTQVIDEHVIEGREPFCIGRWDCPR